MSQALVIRADASVQIGTGHVMRCMALAQEWRKRGGSVCFVSAATSERLRARISEEGFEFHTTCSHPATIQDANELLEIAKQNDAHAVVLDGYHFNEEYHEAVAGSEHVTLAIEDGCRLPYYSTSFVLDQNLGASVTRYPRISGKTHLLLGTEYALLRREFLDANQNQERCEPNGDELRCLVTLGGSDPDNITATVIQGLLLLNDSEMEVRVVLGGVNPHVKTLAQLISGDDRFTLLRNVSNMAEQYAWANFAIAAGGSSNWEMCYFGLPRIVVVIAENQRMIAEHLAGERISLNIGDAVNISDERIAAAVQTLWSDASQLKHAHKRSQELVDGLGAKRVVDRLLNATLG